MAAILPPTPTQPDLATVTGLYLNDYEAIVKPHRQFLISDYFINHWVRRLKPTLSWIVIALQQACWRADHDTCTISQAQLCEEIGINRTTITRALKDPLRHWLIPDIVYNQPAYNLRKQTFQPLPAQYQVYLSPPLIPEHLTALDIYLRANVTSGDVAAAIQALQHLTDLSPKEALRLLEASFEGESRFADPLPLTAVLENATDITLAALPAAKAKALKRKLATLQAHLTRGDTLCRQYFRLTWVPTLGPAFAWLVIALRSRCYYNKSTGELRDTYTWPKKALAAMVGQTTQNLRTRLLKHPFADHFFQIQQQEKHKITLRVGMLEEPLISESAEEYWWRQSNNANFRNIEGIGTQTSATSSELEPKLLQHRTHLNANFSNMAPTVTQTFATQSLKTPQKNNKTQESGLPESRLDDAEQRKQKLFELLCNLPQQGMQAETAHQILATVPPEMILQWLHYVTENKAIKDPVRFLVASILYKGMSAPLPPSSAELEQQRRLREMQWGLRAYPQPEYSELSAQLSEQDETPASLEEQHWQDALRQLQLQMTRATFETWLQQTYLVRAEDETYVIAVENIRAKEWLENRLKPIISRTLAHIVGVQITVEFVVVDQN